MSEIDFTGLYGICNQHPSLLFEGPISRTAGIYLWTARTPNGFIVEYVRQTGESFAKRTKDHVIQTFGGNYRICDARLMREGKLKVVWQGLWRKGTRDKIPEFAQCHLELAPFILDYLRTIEVFLAPVNGDRRFRERIEGALARHIWDQPPPASNLLPRDVRYRQRREDAVPVSVCLRCREKIVGIPSSLWI